MNNRNKIMEYLAKEREVIKGLDVGLLNTAFCVLDDCLQNGKKVYVFGNGGSGSTASHMTNDFNNAIFNDTDKTFDFCCLNDNIPTMLAIANDLDYSDIFVYQLSGKLKKDDVVIAISGSGNSKNIIKAVEYAKECGATVIGFTGYDGGKLKEIANYNVGSNINNMEITEDIHLIVEHMLITTFFEKYGRGKKENKKLTLTREEDDILVVWKEY